MSDITVPESNSLSCLEGKDNSSSGVSSTSLLPGSGTRLGKATSRLGDTEMTC